jgi:hypothetical protein
MTNTVRSYLYAYVGGLILFVITLFVRELSVIYMGLYFLVGLGFVFTFNQPQDVPERSTVTHFERASRWNAYSYILAGALVLASLIISFAPIQPNFSTLIIWSLSCGGLWGLTKFYDSRLLTNIIADYIKQQVPASAPRAVEIVALLQDQHQTTAPDLVTKFGLNPADAERLIYMFRQYVRNNLLAGDTFEEVEEPVQAAPVVAQAAEPRLQAQPQVVQQVAPVPIVPSAAAAAQPTAAPIAAPVVVAQPIVPAPAAPVAPVPPIADPVAGVPAVPTSNPVLPPA